MTLGYFVTVYSYIWNVYDNYSLSIEPFDDSFF